MEQAGQQYVTIKEFATLANVTTQAIYKRLNQPENPLNQYVEYSGKMKLISRDALDLFTDSAGGQSAEESENETESGLLKSQEAVFTSYFDTTLKVLTDQISSKDVQITELINCNQSQHEKMQEQLQAKDKQISELQKLIDQQQQLHRAEQEQFRLLTVSEEKKGFFKRLFHKKEANA
ncbi:MAG: DUF536 domain-containing protein [Oscillospiraceae bacterium]|nr:DUF536 domain-containing protein [Oscillospiraceae bacterium]